MEDNQLKNLRNKLEGGGGTDTKTLSGVVFSSRGKLYRDIGKYSGHTVGVFLRRRRLARALAYIKSSDLPLAALAAECSYSSRQAMCREVKRFTGLTPLQYKESGICHYFAPEISDCGYNITVSEKTLPAALCLKFFLGGSKDIENLALRAFLDLRPEYSGRLYGRNGPRRSGRHCYELYADDIPDAGRLSQRFIVGGSMGESRALYASLTVKNDAEEIGKAWDYLYGRWLSGSMYEYSGAPYYEEYLLSGGRAPKLRLWLPVKKRAGFTNITLEELDGERFCVSSRRGPDAERLASGQVVGWLSENYPYLLKTAKKFYIRGEKESYTCGVRISAPLRLPDGAPVYEIKSARGLCAVLNGSFDLDLSRYKTMLTGWLDANGFDYEVPYAVYDTESGYDNPRVRLFCRIKTVRFDNTNTE